MLHDNYVRKYYVGYIFYACLNFIYLIISHPCKKLKNIVFLHKVILHWSLDDEGFEFRLQTRFWSR